VVEGARGFGAHELVEYVAAHRLWVALKWITPPASTGRFNAELHGAASHRAVGWRCDHCSVSSAAADRAGGASVSSQHADA